VRKKAAMDLKEGNKDSKEGFKGRNPKEGFKR
jgi:hypothetical protein